MSWFSRTLRRIIPDDKVVRCGWGPLSLPTSNRLTPGCRLHDGDYDQAHAGINEHTLDETDELLFWRWTLIAHNQPTPAERCALAMEICKLWPLARIGGKILWDGVDPVVLALLTEAPVTSSEV